MALHFWSLSKCLSLNKLQDLVKHQRTKATASAELHLTQILTHPLVEAADTTPLSLQERIWGCWISAQVQGRVDSQSLNFLCPELMPSLWCTDVAGYSDYNGLCAA